jgi:hypothetical protein
MKNKHLLILFFVAMILVIVGALFKIMHWTGASVLLTVGMLGEVGVILLLILKLLKDNKSEFLNK